MLVKYKTMLVWQFTNNLLDWKHEIFDNRFRTLEKKKKKRKAEWALSFLDYQNLKEHFFQRCVGLNVFDQVR